MLLHVAGVNMSQNGETFKLQFVGKGGGSCAAPSGGTPATYTDLSPSAGLIRVADVTGAADGDDLTTNTDDPTHPSDTVVAQDFEEANNFANTVAAVNIGQDGLWDFALVDNSAPVGTTYCVRAVTTSGDLNTYSRNKSVRSWHRNVHVERPPRNS